MNVESIKTGDIFYYKQFLDLKNKTVIKKCRILFVGTENIFYDAWLDSINQWKCIPVKKRLAFNRFPLTHINNLDFNGYEEIDDISQQKY